MRSPGPRHGSSSDAPSPTEPTGTLIPDRVSDRLRWPTAKGNSSLANTSLPQSTGTNCIRCNQPSLPSPWPRDAASVGPAWSILTRSITPQARGGHPVNPPGGRGGGLAAPARPVPGRGGGHGGEFKARPRPKVGTSWCRGFYILPLFLANTDIGIIATSRTIPITAALTPPERRVANPNTMRTILQIIVIITSARIRRGVP